jgi:hypothetical protein
MPAKSLNSHGPAMAPSRRSGPGRRAASRSRRCGRRPVSWLRLCAESRTRRSRTNAPAPSGAGRERLLVDVASAGSDRVCAGGGSVRTSVRRVRSGSLPPPLRSSRRSGCRSSSSRGSVQVLVLRQGSRCCAGCRPDRRGSRICVQRPRRSSRSRFDDGIARDRATRNRPRRGSARR